MRDPVRLAAVGAVRRRWPAAPPPMDAIARLAARLLNAPMAAITLVDDVQEHFAGVHKLPPELTGDGRASLTYSVCKYIVSLDQPVWSADLLAEQDAELREHPLARQFGVRAFAGVPLRDAGGLPVGSLTVLDIVARPWPVEHLSTLAEVAALLHDADQPAGPEAVDGLNTGALLDSVQEAFLAVDPDGVVVGFNQAAQRLFGYTAEQVCGRHLDASLMPGYDGQPIDLALGRLFEAAPRRPVLRSLTMRHRDGHRLPVRASLSVIRSAAGALACVFLTDLTEQNAAEQLVDRHSSFLTALLDSLSVGVVACDETGRVVLLNHALREVRGWPKDAPLPADYPATLGSLLRYPDLRPMPWQQTPLMRALHGEHVVDADVIAIVPGHRTRRFSATAQPIVGADGRRLGAVAVAHEVTALRRVERFRICHQEVEQQFRVAKSAADAAPDILRAVTSALGWPCAELFLLDEVTGLLRSAGHYDATGHHDDGFFGHTPVRGQGITGRVWDSGQPIWVPDIAGLEQPTPYELDRIRICLGRGIRTVLAVPVRDGGTLLGVLTCYANTPEFHEDLLTVLLDGVAAQIGVYVALRRSEQFARQLTRAQDDFIDLVGHELRTPLTSIAANVGLLADEATAFDPDHRHMIEVIGRNTSTLQRIVDTLLDLAGLDSGQIPLNVQDVDLSRVVSDAITAASRPGIDTDLPDQLHVGGDPARLRQVVDDLLANAITYSPPDSRITVTLQDHGGLAELTIADHGIGIPDAEHERALDRFYRGSNVRHHGISGSGLGLSLAQTIVRHHRGTITLDDNQPTGTIVRVRLPQHRSRL
ncbi:PAS domain S-box-containing protein [Actinoplanes octamycinicus]|uniref:Sensor-like histidine kinase SenX3 n=1 Tax=Actinoplanes octamycinicus TaxID=135948 RepID=A0A7W7H4P6_9ACTN|nr:ATP-binding protein [Actinoplanes octamycinicus]MBB4743873.1 PAS domain S-box-containing protein [Actinoplanes octamycinicus]